MRTLAPPLLPATLLLAVLAGSAGAQTRYLAFGDSVTEGTGDVGHVGGYPIRLDTMLAGAVVENHGFAGERTPEGLSRIDGVLAAGGDVLLLMEGTNDITRAEISQETTLFNLGEMARKAEARGIEAVHATLIPRWPMARRDRDNFETQEVNQSLRDLAGSRGRRLVDNFEVYSVQPDLFARLYTDKLPADPVGHPNPAGYDLMAATFRDVLLGADRVPPVPGVISPNHGEIGVSANAPIVVDVWDFGQGIDGQSVELLVDGEVVPAAVSASGDRVTASYTPPSPLSGLVRVGLRAADTASPVNRFDRELARFSIGGQGLILGDIDFDGRVDGLDVDRMEITFGLRATERAFDERADLNGDGVVDGLDLALLASNFGRSVP